MKFCKIYQKVQVKLDLTFLNQKVKSLMSMKWLKRLIENFRKNRKSRYIIINTYSSCQNNGDVYDTIWYIIVINKVKTLLIYINCIYKLLPTQKLETCTKKEKL